VPSKCPIGLIPFLAPDACENGCPQYDSQQEVCRWFHTPRPIVEIQDTEERLLCLERLTSDFKRQLEDLKALEAELIKRRGVRL